MGDLGDDLDRIIRRDRRTFRNYFLLGGLVILVGLGVLIAGFVAPLGATDEGEGIQALMVKIGGVLISTFSTIPLKQCFDRYERLAAVQLVRDKWQSIAAEPATAAEEIEKIRGIVWKLYEKRVLG